MISVTATAIKSPQMFHYNPTSTAACTICCWMGCYSPQLDFLLHMYINIPNIIYICLQLKCVVNQTYFTQYYLLLWHITLISFTWCHVRFTQGLVASHPPYMGGCILLSCTATLMNKGKRKQKPEKYSIINGLNQTGPWHLIHPCSDLPSGARFIRNSEWLFRFSHYSPDKWAQSHSSLPHACGWAGLLT